MDSSANDERLSSPFLFATSTPSTMSLLVRKASTLIRKGKKISRDPLPMNDTWTDASIANAMPLHSAARPSERQPQTINVTLKAAEIARERRGASGTGEKHATGCETYGIFLDTAQRDDETQEAESSDADSPDLHNMPRDTNPHVAQTRMTRGEIARMRENEEHPIREELDNPAEPMPTSAPAGRC